MDAEVGVIGVGSVGSMVLWRLRKAGFSAIGFEQYAPGHGFGGAGGETRYFRTAYAEGREYVPLLLSSYKLWTELEAEARTKLVWNCNFITVGPLDEGRFADTKACADEAGVAVQLWDKSEAKRRYPQHRYRDDDCVLFDPMGGLHASVYSVACASRLAESSGATIFRGTKVEAIRQEKECVAILTKERTFRVDKLVVTTGAWASDLLADFGPRINPKRRWQAWYYPSNSQSFSVDSFPPFGRVIEGLRVHGSPSLDGKLVCVGTVGNVDEIVSSDDFLGHSLQPDLSVLNDYVANYLVDLPSDPVRVLAAVDAYTEDHHAMVGVHPKCNRIVILAGFSGHGFKLAPVMGQIATDLVKSGSTHHPIKHLDLNRFDRAAP